VDSNNRENPDGTEHEDTLVTMMKVTVLTRNMYIYMEIRMLAEIVGISHIQMEEEPPDLIFGRSVRQIIEV
jgi:hypothetical protein